jgi:hypothetical protein
MIDERWVAACASMVLLIGFIAFWRRARDRAGSGFDAITAFLGVWGVALALFAVPWVKYTPTRTVVWVVVYASILMFVVGGFIAYLVAPKAPAVLTAPRFSLSRLRRAWLLFLSLGLIGFAFFVRAIDDLVGWKTLFTNLELARSVQGTDEFEARYGVIKLLTYANIVGLLLWTVALRAHAFTGYWRVAAPLGLAGVIPYFFLGERLSFLTATVIIMLFHLLWAPISAKRLLAVGLAAVACSLVYFNVVAEQKKATLDRHPEIAEQLTTDRGEQFVLPYVYMTANIPTFSKLTADPIVPRTEGQMLILPLIKAAHLVAPLEGAPPELGAFYPIPFESYNSPTWLGAFYFDLGFLGCLLLPLVVGFAATLAVVWARRRRTFGALLVCAVALHIVVFSPLTNRIPDATTWQLLVAAPVLSAIITRQDTGDSRQAPRSSLFRSRRGGVLVFAAAIALVGCGVGLVWVAQRDSEPERLTRSVVGRRLLNVMSDVRKAYPHGQLPSNWALVTQLQVSRPALPYVELESAAGSPEAAGVVGVFASGRAVQLRARTATGEVIQVEGRYDGKDYSVFGPDALSPSGLIVDGSFEEPLAASWLVIDPQRDRVSRTSDAAEGAFALRVRFTKHSAPISVTQSIVVHTRARSKRYHFEEHVRPAGLTRSVFAGFQFIYTDGSSNYVAAGTGRTPRSNTEASGIPAGSSNQWITIRASRIPIRALRAIRVFAVDPGRRPLQGTLLVDSVSLTATDI